MEQQIVFTNSKRQKLFGVLHTPERAKATAIICCHGFSRNKVDKFRMWVRIARALCESGFVVLRFDFSGHGDSFGEMGDFLVSQGIDDLECAIKYLEELPAVEKKKIGIIGHSMGGEIAILEAAKNSEIKALVLLAPVADYKQLLGDFPRAISEAQKYGSAELASHNMKKEYFEELLKFAPLDEIKRIKIPLLVVHGDADDRVGISGSKELIKKSNEPKKLVIINGADHDFFGYGNTMQMISETIRWFSEHLEK